MKDIFKSPFIDSDSDMEEECGESSSDEEELHDEDENESDPEDHDYIPSDSDTNSSESSGSSVPSGEDEELSDIEENSDEFEHEGAEIDEPEPMSVQEASDNEDIRMPMDEGAQAVRSPRANFLAEQLKNAKFDECLPDTCKVEFENNKLDAFKVTVTPKEGYWQGGNFQFDVNYPKDYQLAPPLVKCKSNTFHPMISKDGILGLKILRPTMVGDKSGWHAGRQMGFLYMKEIVLALNAMFSDPIEVNEPRNEEAAELLQKDQAEFATRVKNCIAGISQ